MRGSNNHGGMAVDGGRRVSGMAAIQRNLEKKIQSEKRRSSSIVRRGSMIQDQIQKQALELAALSEESKNSSSGGNRISLRGNPFSFGKTPIAPLRSQESPEHQGRVLRISQTAISMDDIVSCEFYNVPKYLYYTTKLMCILSLGLLNLLCYLKPSLNYSIWYRRVDGLENATSVLVTMGDHRKYHVMIEKNEIDGDCIRYIIVRCKKYIWEKVDDGPSILLPLRDIDINFTNNFLTEEMMKFRNPKETGKKRNAMSVKYGKNEIVIPMHPYIIYLILEASSPFFLFQYASCAIWFYEEYYSYSSIILVITAISIFLNVQQTYLNRMKIKNMANVAKPMDFVHPSADLALEYVTYYTRSSAEAVPGDFIIIRSGQVMSCDAVLVMGECVVDENVLTGETLPVRKIAFARNFIQNKIEYNPVLHAPYTLYAGTTVNLAQGINSFSTIDGSDSHGCIAVVCRTGFFSAKGELIRSIMFPKVHDLKYSRDALLFIVMMGTGGCLLYIWSATTMLGFHSDSLDIFVKFLDIITVAVPPALAAALSIAVSISVARLDSIGVAVSDSERITWAGLTNAVCFDKTGTLTEKGLDFFGVLPAGADENDEPAQDASIFRFKQDILESFSCCHSLSIIGREVVGDNLELRLFEATGSEMTQTVGEKTIRTKVFSPILNDTWTLERRFDFSSYKMRSGVVCRKGSDQKLSFHVKGSPEAIAGIVERSSLPDNFTDLVSRYTSQGLRVLAFASRSMTKDEDYASPTDQMPLETNLHYGGLILLANRLKDDTVETIACMNKANIKVAMVTGDHIRTAVAVAYECDIIPSEIPCVLLDSVVAMKASEGKKIRQSAERKSKLGILERERRSRMEEAELDTLRDEDSKVHTSASDLETPESSFLGSSVPLSPASLLPTKAKASADTTAEDELAYPGISSMIIDCYVVRKNLPGDTKISLRDAFDAISRNEVALAITGRAIHNLAAYNLELFSFCIGKGAVFARMEPEDKALVIDTLGDGILTSMDPADKKHERFFYTAFCGDGANDIAALKSAIVGVSLDSAEASVAAPLTAFTVSPLVMVKVLLEGRCALIGSFAIFKYIMVYAFVQTFGTCLLYSLGLVYTDNQFLIMDFFFATVLAATMSFTRPVKALPNRMPSDRFFTTDIIVPVFAHFVVVAIFQLVVVHTARGFYPDMIYPVHIVNGTDASGETIFIPNPTILDTDQQLSFECSSSYIMALIQYVVGALVMDESKPFRRYWITNPHQVFAVVCQCIIIGMCIFLQPSITSFECKEGLTAHSLNGDGDWSDIRTAGKLLSSANGTEVFSADQISRMYQTLTTCISQCEITSSYLNATISSNTLFEKMQCLVDSNSGFADRFFDAGFNIRQGPDMSYRWMLLGLGIAHTVVSLIVDFLVRVGLKRLHTKVQYGYALEDSYFSNRLPSEMQRKVEAKVPKPRKNYTADY
jgi:predicted P-type ATPase